MKKKVLAIAIAALTFTSLASSAQKKFDGKCKSDKRELSCKGDSCRSAQRCYNPFEGLGLTADQQKKIDELKADCKQKRDRDRAAGMQQKKDEISKRRAQAKESRAKYLKDVKSILTPEQYVQFLENNFVNSPRQQKFPDRKFNKGGKKHDLRKGDLRRGEARKGDFKNKDK